MDIGGILGNLFTGIFGSIFGGGSDPHADEVAALQQELTATQQALAVQIQAQQAQQRQMMMVVGLVGVAVVIAVLASK